MVRPRLLVPVLAAAALLVAAGYMEVVVPHAFVRPCPDGPEDHGGGLSPVPSPDPGPAAASAAGEDGGGVCQCLRVSRSVLDVITFFVGVLIGSATSSIYIWLADGEDEEEDASGAAKKAGYVAIADGPEAATGKN